MSIVVTAFLVVIKYSFGTLSGSIAKKSAFFVLEDAYVEFEETDADTVEENIKELKA